MEDTDKNKEKLLALLNDRNAQDSVEISYKKPESNSPKPETSEKPDNNIHKSVFKILVNSPTPFKPLNYLFWFIFITFDICAAFVIYLSWF